MIAESSIRAGNIYDKYGSRNPLVRLLMRRFLSTLEELIGLCEVSHIHEVGCGEGDLARFMAKPAGRIIRASDVSREIICLAKDRDHEGSVDFMVRDIYGLDSIRDASQLIVCCEVLEHLEYPHRAFYKLSQLAKPYCIVSVPREPLWRCLNLCRARYIRQLGSTPGHIQHWSVKSLSRLFSKYFDIIQVRTPLPWIVALGKVRSSAAGYSSLYETSEETSAIECQ